MSAYRSCAVLFALCLVSCGGGRSNAGPASPIAPQPSATPPPAAPAQQKTITLIQYNDLHAHLTPHADLVRQQDGSAQVQTRGGLARVATLVKQIRAENQASVLMNIGDTFHGGVEALYTDGNAIAAPINALGIDVGVPGNWDWAYGPDVTRLRYRGVIDDGCPLVAGMRIRYGTPEVARPTFPNLGGNARFAAPGRRTGEPFLPATMILDRNGVKIGFIGITSDMVARMHPVLVACIDFLQGEQAHADYLREHARALRAAGATVVVAMSELGIQKDWRLANVIEAGLVDVIFSAHTHETTEQPLQANNGTWVVEAGNDGYIGRMDVTVGADGAVRDRRWRLLAVTADIPEDGAMKALVDAARARFLQPNPDLALREQFGGHVLRQSIDTVIGVTPQLLSRRHALDNTFNRSFSEALRRITGTDLALTPGFRFDVVLAPTGLPLENDTVASGAITLEDAYRLFPAPMTLATGRVSGSALREILEFNLATVFSTDVFEQSGGWTDGFAGLSAQVALTAADGARVKALARRGGATIADGDNLTIAGCRRPGDADSITLCSYEAFTAVTDLLDPASGKPWYVTDFLAYALHSGQWPDELAPALTDQSSLPQWPESPYVQPIEGAKP